MSFDLNDCKVPAVDPDFSFEEVGFLMSWDGMNHNAFVAANLLLTSYFKLIIFRSNKSIRIILISSPCRFTRHERLEDMSADKPGSFRGNDCERFLPRRNIFHVDNLLCDNYVFVIADRIGSDHGELAQMRLLPIVTFVQSREKFSSVS